MERCKNSSGTTIPDITCVGCPLLNEADATARERSEIPGFGSVTPENLQAKCKQINDHFEVSVGGIYKRTSDGVCREAYNPTVSGQAPEFCEKLE
ncbi:hypothetical protein JXA63_05770 [Candidatus Woesebacteria bacterium]|nr:hypothetical protein [Candidatus Woesebacteria bacterium]